MMNYYYERGTGKTAIKHTLKRKTKRALKWYFNDKFSFTLNIISIIIVIL